MKKIKTLLIIIGILFMTTACNERKNTDLNIATTIYPINYLVEQIHEEGNIISIYPDGADVKNYALTEKRIKEYSSNDIFIYNGLSNELNIAKDLINQNKKLHVIDVAYGLNVSYGIEELWLSPNYYLMLANTIKNNLEEITKSKYLNDEIEKKYKTLEETLSLMDAELRNIAKDAKNRNHETIVASSNVFKYLNNYGFNVISLEDEINTTTLKNNFKNNTYTTIFMKSTEDKTELISTLESDCNAKVVIVNTMETLTTEEKENNENYLTIMDEYIENIRKVTLGE